MLLLSGIEMLQTHRISTGGPVVALFLDETLTDDKTGSLRPDVTELIRRSTAYILVIRIEPSVAACLPEQFIRIRFP
jgi:hypothetical protein